MSGHKRVQQAAGVVFVIGLLFLLLYVPRLQKDPLFEYAGLHPSKFVEAMYYESLPDQEVRCLVCPRSCVIKNGQRGFCKARLNTDGRLVSLVYGDTIAKVYTPETLRYTPVYYSLHKNILGLGTPGCVFRCSFCVSAVVSQATPGEFFPGPSTDPKAVYCSVRALMKPEDVIQYARKTKCEIIMYNTLNEPTVNYEYVLAVAQAAKKANLTNVLMTSGYINEQPLAQLLKYMDGVSLGLKGFTEKFYGEYCGASLAPVLATLKFLKKSGIGLEITYVLIPTANDSEEEIKSMCSWVVDNLGTDVPLQFIRYYPSYRLTGLPPTPISTMESAQTIARQAGIKSVYAYDMGGALLDQGLEEKVYCPGCHKLILSREKGGVAYDTDNIEDGKCKFCGYQVLFIKFKTCSIQKQSNN